MSGSYTNTDGRAESLNRTAAHDTALYDPNQHDNQIVAVFDSNTRACTARDALIGAGIPRSAIHVIDRTFGDADPQHTDAEDRSHGFWNAIKSLFVPEEDATAYSHAVERGHAMVVVVPTATMDRHRVIQVLESTHPIDFDAKLEEWRQAGYDNLPQGGAVSAANQDTGYRTGTADSGAGSVNLVEERMRVGRRETPEGAVRVRSYVADRAAEQHVRLHEERMGDTGGGTGGEGTGATPGVASSGMNSSRS